MGGEVDTGGSREAVQQDPGPTNPSKPPERAGGQGGRLTILAKCQSNWLLVVYRGGRNGGEGRA